MAVEKEATTTVAVMGAGKEVTNSVRCYNALAVFEVKVREAVCDAFIEDFEECKRWHSSSISPTSMTSYRSSLRTQVM